MSLTAPAVYQPTAVEGLVQDASFVQNASGLSTITPAPHLAIVAGRQLNFAGQTANTSGAAVAHQAVGTVSIPSGTASGGTVVVSSGLIGAQSQVFLQVRGFAGVALQVAVTALTASIAGTPGSFTITTQSTGVTVGAVDVWFWIVN